MRVPKQQKLLKMGFASALLVSMSAQVALANEEAAPQQIKPQIVGGSVTTPYSRTYQAMLVSTSGQQFCGGTLIGDEWVLTAAHCVDNASASRIRVRLGAHYRTGNEGQLLGVSQIIRHQNWNTNNIGNGWDIALLRLSGTANAEYERAVLPTVAKANEIAGVGDYVVVSGWGNTSNRGSASNVLKEASLPIINNSQCENSPGHVICGGGSYNLSACNGDSGGPFVARQNGISYSIGSVSWGINCSGFTAFTRTTSFLGWIEQITGITPGDDNTQPPTGGSKLKNGVPLTNLSGARSSETFYTIEVPADATNLKVAASGGSGDADLYVRYGDKPTTSAYDCRPYLDKTSNESCNIDNPQEGTYHVMLRGYTSYSGLQLVGTHNGKTDTTPPKDNFVEIPNISGTRGKATEYFYTNEAGRKKLTISISGGTGDADLYVQFGTNPTTGSYDCRPYKNGNVESCTFENPQVGDYFIDLHGYKDFSGITLRVEWE